MTNPKSKSKMIKALEVSSKIEHIENCIASNKYTVKIDNWPNYKNRLMNQELLHYLKTVLLKLTSDA